MRHVISLEAIGDNLVQYARARASGRARESLGAENMIRMAGTDRPAVHRVRDAVGAEMDLDPVKYTKDYAQANSTGSRGVRLIFIVDEGFYRVRKLTSWKNAKNYFVQVTRDGVLEVDERLVRAHFAMNWMIAGIGGTGASRG